MGPSEIIQADIDGENMWLKNWKLGDFQRGWTEDSEKNQWTKQLRNLVTQLSQN